MRIGLITPGFCASEEDWCVPALTDLVRVLAERDETAVFALRYPHRREPYRVQGAAVFPTGGAQRGGLARLPILARTLARVLREARRRPFDVLCGLWAHEPGFVAAVAGRRTRTPVVVSILGGELVNLPEIDYGGGRSRANRWLAGRALASADAVTVGSKALEGLAAARVPREKLVILPLGVDRERFRPGPPAAGPANGGAPRLDGAPRLLNVASFSPVKDHRTLLETFAILTRDHPEARLHLVGSGVLEGRIVAEARRLGLGARVELHGQVDHGRLADAYRQADLFLSSSRFEAQGMALLEAVACGCPVVGTAVGVLPELGSPEALAEPGDAGALASAADAVLVDPERRKRLIAVQSAALAGFELRLTAERLRRRFADLAGRAV